MAIEINKRTKIMAGVAVLVLAGAGAAAWFLFLDEPPPPVAKAPAKAAPAKPAAPKADAGKPAEVAKADAPKSDAAKPADAGKSDAPKAADAPKADAGKASAAAPAKPGAKPIPSDPDKLIAEVIETSGLRAYFQTFGREAMVKAGTGNQAQQASLTPAEHRNMVDIVERVFEPGKMQAELAANLKGSFDAERMARFLELLRQPIALKMTSTEIRQVSPEAMREYSENFRKSPPPAARAKLIQALDEVTRTSEVGADMATAMARDMVDAMLDSMQKAGKQVPKEARQMVGSQLNSMRTQARGQMRTMMYVMYREATDEELAEYVKLLDTDTGRWGSELLANAMRPVMVSRGSALGREVAQFAMARQGGAMARAAARPKVEEEKPEEKLPTAATTAAAAAPAVPAEPPAYQRPANIRTLYSKYNDLMTATVMRDAAAVKELLADGKNPNVRQSDGVTPLMVAAGNGDGEIASLLLARGADPNLKAPGGNSAMSIAKARNNGEMVKLLERGASR